MLYNFKYSWLLFSRGGWKALLNIIILFCFFTFLGTLAAYSLENQYLHVGLIIYLLVYIDNTTLRFFSPIDLTHLLPFPESRLKKYLRLVIIESMGTKLYLISIYILIQLIFNRLYAYPQVILLCALAFAAYQFLFIPVLMMVKRKTTYAYIFRGFAPVIMILPVVLMRRSSGRYKISQQLLSFINSHLWTLTGAVVIFAALCFVTGVFFFRRIYAVYPFQDEEVIEKLKRFRK